MPQPSTVHLKGRCKTKETIHNLKTPKQKLDIPTLQPSKTRIIYVLYVTLLLLYNCSSHKIKQYGIKVMKKDTVIIQKDLDAHKVNIKPMQHLALPGIFGRTPGRFAGAFPCALV